MTLLFFLAALVVLAHSSAPCTVSSCAARMTEVANAFSCRDESSCRAALAAALVAIAPVDAADEWQRRGAAFATVLRGADCWNVTLCNLPRFFVAWSDWSRVPDAWLSVSAQLDAATRELQQLENGTCAAPQSAEEADAWIDKGCGVVVPFATMKAPALQQRQLYAVRRERAFLSDLSRACLVWAGTACSAVVSEAATAADKQIALLGLPQLDTEMFIGPRFPEVFGELNSRTCGGADPGRQCVAELVQPVLAAGGDERAVQAALNAMLASFEPSSAAASDALFAEMIKNASQPVYYCGFGVWPSETGSFAPVCSKLLEDRISAYNFFLAHNPWLLVTSAQVTALEEELR
jgi:hypothetical protein